MKLANVEAMVISAAAYILLRVGDQSTDSEILITPDLEGRGVDL